MIKFDEKELKYIIEQFSNVVNNTIAGLGKLEDEAYADYIRSIGEDSLETAREVTNNIDILEKVNIDEVLNKRVSDAIYWIDGMWCFIDSYTDTEELKKLLDNQNESYYTIYNKILHQDDPVEIELIDGKIEVN